MFKHLNDYGLASPLGIQSILHYVNPTITSGYFYCCHVNCRLASVINFLSRLFYFRVRGATQFLNLIFLNHTALSGLIRTFTPNLLCLDSPALITKDRLLLKSPFISFIIVCMSFAIPTLLYITSSVSLTCLKLNLLYCIDNFLAVFVKCPSTRTTRLNESVLTPSNQKRLGVYRRSNMIGQVQEALHKSASSHNE